MTLITLEYSFKCFQIIFGLTKNLLINGKQNIFTYNFANVSKSKQVFQEKNSSNFFPCTKHLQIKSNQIFSKKNSTNFFKYFFPNTNFFSNQIKFFYEKQILQIFSNTFSTHQKFSNQIKLIFFKEKHIYKFFQIFFFMHKKFQIKPNQIF